MGEGIDLVILFLEIYSLEENTRCIYARMHAYAHILAVFLKCPKIGTWFYYGIYKW